MNKIFKILPFLLLTVIGCKAQDKETSDFIPKGYVEFEKYFGDLNKDGQDDCVIVIKQTDTNNIVTNRFDKKVDRNRRGIIVLFKNGKGFELADKNYNCFSSENEDGGVYFSPDLWIEIKNEKLYVHYGHGRYGYWEYTFRFQNSNFELIGYDSSSNRGPVTSTETSINFLTKKKLIKENTNENAEGGDEIFKETWNNIEIENLIKLSEIKDFDELDMYNY
ncbi:hypothetical protein [Olleya sp. Hel_I_94]|jgi:hypothetical protein|uniref:hypothetical protein n=1 Tax=Olleya sp. Hel_I_94 TaxID=1250001 RepID=UPI0011AA849F|nr:hypothetical protein [Olleya sp. Hel_I_94]TVZ49859.1 hypothetical protein JM82_0298 [Olleya sp. Hel_I_94]TVZ49875.1 hypothetical protein JM82_0314 [Olleya sp. Hel_I_94]